MNRRLPVNRAGARTRVLAPAKLTLSLEVTGVRPDGYHELRAEMVTLDLADELEFDEGGSGLTVDVAPGSRGEGLVGQNLVLSALQAAGRTAGVHLTKRIPVGGGLGGGSADAAAVLRWAGVTDPVDALQLGADVPFCLVGGRALVEGIGERVTPLPFEPCAFFLLVPPFGVDTAAVYRAWDEGRRVGGDGDGAVGHDGPSGVWTNELTDAALATEPRLEAWRDALRELTGAEPRLAGSGSTWFVEGGPPEAGTAPLSELRVGAERGFLLRAATVPAGWDGG